MDKLEKKIIGVLYGGCIGDVLGSFNENVTYTDIRAKKRYVTKFIKNQYTDDTELTLILSDYLINFYYDKAPHSMVKKIHSMYHHVVKNSFRGYSKRTKDILSNWNDCTLGGNADTNGGVMRIAPLALIHNSDSQLRQNIKLATYCTHGENKDASDVAFLHIKLLKSLINDDSQSCNTFYNYALHITAELRNEKLYPLLITLQNGILIQGNVTKNIFGYDLFQIKAIQCYVCVLVCFLQHYLEPEKAIIKAANLGGDTDTIAKLVGELVGAKNGLDWIPKDWQNPEGYATLHNNGQRLYQLYQK